MFINKETEIKVSENFDKFENSPLFIIKEGFNPLIERETETLLACGNGYAGSRNSLEEFTKMISNPATFIAGTYETLHERNLQLLPKMPDWTRFQIYIENRLLDLFSTDFLEHRRYIDLRKGIACRKWKCIDPIGRITDVTINKFISFEQKNILYKEINIRPENYCSNLLLISGIDGKLSDDKIINIETSLAEKSYILEAKSKFSSTNTVFIQKSNFRHLTDKFCPIKYQIKEKESQVFEQWIWHAKIDEVYRVRSLIYLDSTADKKNFEKKHYLIEDAQIHLKCKNNHIKEWIKHFRNAQVKITGDLYAQKSVNFAVYHLITAGRFSGNKFSIPARGLTGESYEGHVFWDTEIYLLPFYILVFPDIAKALLMYRYNTLDGARKNALNEGYKGASYAWESTDTGIEQAPESVLTPSGEVIRIYSGNYENHITPDVAYAVWQYYIVTKDNDFLFDYGAEILFETARFCISNLKLADDEKFHILNVIGPDEYHELVDDNFYTNMLVKNNLNIALETFEIMKQKAADKLANLTKKIYLEQSEIDNWNLLKDKIYLPEISEDKIFEQFKGYFGLNDINVNEFEPRTVAMDIILGRENTGNSKVVKQPDVLMAIFLLKNNFTFNEISANYNYYEPKTGHGSSLSPSIHSIIASWIGNDNDAYKYFKQNADIDLGNNMGNASGGIHIASVGGMWMSVIFGFAGLYISQKGLSLSPNLPDKWETIAFSIIWHENKIDFKINNSHVFVKNNGEGHIFLSFDNKDWHCIKSAEEIMFNKSFNDKWRQVY